jgi:DNA-binding FadR family transcriptional regulator
MTPTTREEKTRGDRTPRRAPERASEYVFRELAAEILRGERPPGSALPAEREIAARFDVSTVVVRQALYQLQELDLIEVRQGRASTVRNPDDALDLRVMVLQAQLAEHNPEDVRDFAEALVLHLANLLELAERRVTDSDLAEITNLADAVAASASALNTTAFREAETHLWGRIAKATRNRLLWKQTRWWFRFLARTEGVFGRQMSTPDVRAALYREVVEALRHQRGAAALYRARARELIDERLGPSELGR